MYNVPQDEIRLDEAPKVMYIGHELFEHFRGKI